MFQLDMTQIEMISRIFGCCYLALLSIQDFKKRTISGKVLAAGAVIVIIFQSIVKLRPVEIWIAGGLLGAMFIGVSKITKEGIGYGDSFLITIMGMYLGIWDLMYILIVSFTMAALYSMTVLVRHQYHRKRTLPFVPFLFLGYLIFIGFQII